MPRHFILAVLAILASASLAYGQLNITEIMYDPNNTEDDWEWIEIVNNGAAIDFGVTPYVVDDINSVALSGANITSGSIGTGEVAVLYNADDLSASTFQQAWGSGSNLIPVSQWSALQLNNGGDQVGIWDDFGSYSGDNETHANVVAGVTYDDSDPWPNNNNSASIEFQGGDPDDGNNWILNQDGVQNAFQSAPLAGSQINNTNDAANPGVLPTSPPTGGLRITEVMNNPASPEDDWEWVEIFNGTGASVDLAGYVIDDNNSIAHPSANILSGMIAAGELAILYNADDLSATNFADAWGDDLNLIAVTNWSAMQLNNSGDTIGIWDNFAAYAGDNVAQNNAIEQVTFGNIDDGMTSLSFDAQGNAALSTDVFNANPAFD